MIIKDLEVALNPRRHDFFMMFAHRSVRPVVFEEVFDDCKSVINGIAKRYTDDSCMELHFDNLVQEGMRKLAQLFDKDRHKMMPNGKHTTRASFFGFFKTAVNNHVKGLVQRHRFTIKRTGQRPPKVEKDDLVRLDDNAEKTYYVMSIDQKNGIAMIVARRDDDTGWYTSQVQVKVDRLSKKEEYRKHVEVSFDDPDCHLQVSHDMDTSFIDSLEYRDIITDMKMWMTPLEGIVFRQMCEPNREAMIYSAMDAKRGGDDADHVKVRYQHMAKGLGMELDTFLSTKKTIQEKVKMHLTNTVEDTKYSAALHQLEQVFDLAIPRSIEVVVIKRMFTLAARDNPEKITDDVAALLELVGAKRPVMLKDGGMGCFGILHEPNHKTCIDCGLREACSIEVANLGLNTITLSPKALSARQVRTPAISMKPSQDGSAVVAQTASASYSERDHELVSFMNEHFRFTTHKQDRYYRHRDKRPDGKVRFIFRSGPMDQPFYLLFCNPCAELKPKLQKIKNGYYLPEATTADQAFSLIEHHAKEAFLASA